MKVQASLSAVAAVFAFDPSPGTSAGKALRILTDGKGLPRAELAANDRFADAALRAIGRSGVDLGKRTAHRLNLIGLEDDPGRARSVTALFYGTAAYASDVTPGQWIPIARSLRFPGADNNAFKAALERLRTESRQLAGAVSLLGEIFTADELLRLHVALQGGTEGSERTFRRRVQELRDSGVLKPVRASEVATLRSRIERFRSQAGTGGRPPELLRYSGGGDHEQLASLRARRLG